MRLALIQCFVVIFFAGPGFVTADEQTFSRSKPAIAAVSEKVIAPFLKQHC
ncbi:MAG: hypothetical protein ACI8P0_006200 [Planctomycetaceae bacterium]|jgi:hypothetical protein